jgi:hypothetical protein
MSPENYFKRKKKITTIQYLHIFHLVIPGTLLYVLHCDEFKHHSSQNHESLDALI